MGQMTYAVMYGAEMASPKSLGDDGWWTMIDQYRQRDGADTSKPAYPHGDTDFEGIGFWCAVGASGERGVPDLAGFPLDDFGGGSPEHAEALNRAKESWVRFSTWCAEPHSGGKGKSAWKTPAINLPAPRLYLVQTEVA